MAEILTTMPYSESFSIKFAMLAFWLLNLSLKKLTKVALWSKREFCRCGIISQLWAKSTKHSDIRIKSILERFFLSFTLIDDLYVH